MARIAVGGFQHETNTFAPQQATWEEFVRADAWPPLLRGAEMIPGVEGFNIPIAGAVQRLPELGHEIDGRLGGAARCEQIVDDDHALASAERVDVHFENVRAVLELVAHRMMLVR